MSNNWIDSYPVKFIEQQILELKNIKLNIEFCRIVIEVTHLNGHVFISRIITLVRLTKYKITFVFITIFHFFPK